MSDSAFLRSTSKINLLEINRFSAIRGATPEVEYPIHQADMFCDEKKTLANHTGSQEFYDGGWSSQVRLWVWEDLVFADQLVKLIAPNRAREQLRNIPVQVPRRS